MLFFGNLDLHLVLEFLLRTEKRWTPDIPTSGQILPTVVKERDKTDRDIQVASKALIIYFLTKMVSYYSLYDMYKFNIFCYRYAFHTNNVFKESNGQKTESNVGIIRSRVDGKAGFTYHFICYFLWCVSF